MYVCVCMCVIVCVHICVCGCVCVRVYVRIKIVLALMTSTLEPYTLLCVYVCMCLDTIETTHHHALLFKNEITMQLFYNTPLVVV